LAPKDSSAERELRRDLHCQPVLAIVVEAIVGTRIYIRAASIAQPIGSSTLIIAAWLAGGILSVREFSLRSGIFVT
jgi:hypothetical protein